MIGEVGTPLGGRLPAHLQRYGCRDPISWTSDSKSRN